MSLIHKLCLRNNCTANDKSFGVISLLHYIKMTEAQISNTMSKNRMFRVVLRKIPWREYSCDYLLHFECNHNYSRMYV